MTAGAIKLGDGTAPAWSGAGEGIIFFDSATGAPTALNSQTGAAVPLGGGGGGVVGPSNVLYVDASGNDGTAVRGDASKPFLTIQAAVASASDGDQVRIGPGLWDVSFIQIIPSVTRLSIVGSGITSTVLARTGGAFSLFSLPSTMKRCTLSDFAVVDSTLQTSIDADGTGGGGAYLGEGLVLRNLLISNNGGLTLNAAYVSRLFIENLDAGGVLGSNITINTCRIERFFNVRWGNVFRFFRNLDAPSAPSSLSSLHVDVISAARSVSAGSVYLGGHPNVLFDDECYLGGGLGVDPFGPALSVSSGGATPQIRFYGEAATSINFQSVFGSGIPDTANPVLLDFSGAKTPNLALDTAAWGGVNRQKVRANGLICPNITAANGIDIYDRFADGAQVASVTASGPSGFGGNDGTYTPGRWSGKKKLAGAPANASFGFTAIGTPHSVQVTSESAAMGFAIPTVVTDSYVTCDASVLASGNVYVAVFWKEVY